MSKILEPYVKLTVNDKPLPTWMYDMMTSVTFKEADGEGANETLEINFDDPELQVMESNLFREKKTKIECAMGYIGGVSGTLFDGVVETVENDYPKSGKITLKIMARDTGYKMSEGEKTKKWKGKTYSDIAKDIGAKYGLKVIADDTNSIFPRSKKLKGGKTELSTLNQSGMSDLKFLQYLASKSHYQLKIDSSTKTMWFVSYKKKLKSATNGTFDYKEGNEKLQSFKPKFNDYEKAMKVKSANINIDNNKLVDGKGKPKKKKSQPKQDSKAKKNAKTYTVKSGDCLFKIAKQFYGDGNKYKKIVSVNKDVLGDTNVIYKGQVLVIP